MIVCAGDIESFGFAKAIGIGLVNSSIKLSKLCLEHKPKELTFIGSAGSYGEYNTFDIIESKKASNIELSFLNNDSYTPLNNMIESENDSINNDTIVNSSNYITINDDLAKKYKDYSVGIENMEFFSVLSVAKEFGIKASGIFIVTNQTNKNAHEDFKKNHKEAMTKLTKYLLEKKII